MDFEDIWQIFLRFLMSVCLVILMLNGVYQAKKEQANLDKLVKRIDNLEQSLRTKDKELERYLIKEAQNDMD